MELSRQDEQFLGKDSAKKIEIINAEGSLLFARNGEVYIDFTSGMNVGNFGWENDEVLRAIREFEGPEYVSPHFESRARAELAELLAEITPGALQKCFRATGGTEAVEIALQAAMAHTRRDKFISIEGSYHGNSLAARFLASSDLGEWYTHRPFGCERIKPPLNEEAANLVEEQLKNGDIAALIMEPIIINLGVLIPERAFMERVQELCRRHGTLLIMDEVATGFGRTGRPFACEHFDIRPDIMCLAKSITGGAAPLGTAIMTAEVGESMEKDDVPYSTYGWHPISVAAAIANIKYYQKHRKEIEENTERMGEYFHQRLSQMPFASTPEIRRKGLAIALYFENDEEYAQVLCHKAEKKGLILSESDTISMFPNLNIDMDTASRGLDILESCLTELLQ